AVNHNSAALADDVLIMTFSGLSKAYRVCGFRAGWMAISGPRHLAADYIEGINLLTNMRLCANVPAQHAIQTALGGYQSINDFLLPGGRLKEQRDTAYRLLNEIDGVSVQQAQGAMYLFPKLDREVFRFDNDEQFALDLLKQQKILISHGRAFNWITSDHFRLVTLPSVPDLEEAIGRIAEFLDDIRR
ncbi:MAG: aminotransferase class I/II-fold pyridoxal phosphate-dependent enzyme, partial [Micrococcaceae bacterium]|nr:aminotransferase class I/II-fold pyridoxal phosphate-dependent enzyme [Micrococcaceae bacterium]